MYCMGEIDFQVIPTNIPRALEWFRKSAELNYPQAQATLGALYLKGLPGLLPKNTKMGIEMLASISIPIFVFLGKSPGNPFRYKAPRVACA